MALTFMDGNEAVARGAMVSGCSFFAGYPITPATTIFNHMLKLLPPAGGIALQGEDEIASMGYCIGASLAGRKALTATSGPGISLYSEQISMAIATETPLVIVDVQRLGPSTGSATKGADSDIQFLRWGSTGGVPVIVLAPRDVVDCYQLTAHAFNYAERFRCPVFLASNKEIGLTKQSFDLDSIDMPAPVTRSGFTGEQFLPFAADPAGSPAFLPVGGDHLTRTTSSTHGPDGFITNDPEIISATQHRLRDKILAAKEEITHFDETVREGADTLVISYGVTANSVDDGAKELARQGIAVATLTLKTLWPVPEQLIRDKAAPYTRVVVVEMNLGQYLGEIERLLPEKEMKFLGQMNGVLITPQQIIEVIQHG